MSERLISKIEKTDIKAPEIQAGGTAIVLQRHGKYNRDRNAENAGSITDSEELAQLDRKFFNDLLAQEQQDGVETVVLFVSSETQYAGKGYRSMETGQVAQVVASEAFLEAGIDPSERIINFNEDYSTSGSEATGQPIRPMKGIVEPKMFDETPEFVKELGRKYNPPEVQADIDARRTDVQLSPQAFAAYEADEPGVRELRELYGAEGVHDIVDRTKKSLRILERYSKIFHAKNPNKRLVIWATSHYDTISPLVKEATDTDFSDYMPVDYGAGVIIELPSSGETTLGAQGEKVSLQLGKVSVSSL